MAKTQTRRSISFSRADYEAAQEAARHAKTSLAQLAADALHEYLERRSAQTAAMRTSPAPVGAAASDLGANEVPIDELIDRSSVGAGLRNIRENGIDTELASLDGELLASEHADVQVMYDDDVQAKRTAAARRKR